MEPVNTTVVPVWTDNSPLKPTYQRVAKGAAEGRRTAELAAGRTWNLNAAQGGDTTLIVNTTEEITDMVAKINAGAGITTAVQNFYINTFDISHNVMPLGGKCVDRTNPFPGNGSVTDPEDTCNYVLGSEAGGGCVMCHSSSNPSDPNYSNKSVGFFDRTHTLFSNPTQTDSACGDTAGMHQTTIGGVKRVAVKFSTIKSDGSANTIDLSDVADCAPVGNTLNQGVVLGYTSTQLANLMGMFASNPEPTPVAGGPTARFSYRVTGKAVEFDGSSSLNTTSWIWDFGGAGTSSGSDPAKPTFTYTDAATYTVTLITGNTTTTATHSKSLSVTVNAVYNKPTANFNITGNAADRTVTIVDASTGDAGDAVTIFVNWGDSSFATGATGTTLNHQYSRNGLYKIAVIAKGSKGLSDSMVKEAVVGTNATISGMVTAGSTSAGGALISLVSGTTVVQQTYSSVTGTYTGTYTLSSVASGTYTVKASKYGYVFADVPDVYVASGANVAGIDFNGSPVTTALLKIAGWIENAIPGIMVRLTDADGTILQQQLTDGDGKFYFAGLAFGDYTVNPMPEFCSACGNDANTVLPDLKSAVSVTTLDVLISRSTFTYTAL